MYEELDQVVLADGTPATILLVFDNGAAYEVDIYTPDGPSLYEQRTVTKEEIAEKVGHV